MSRVPAAAAKNLSSVTAAASVTRETEAIVIVVSESAVVRVFEDGEIVGQMLSKRVYESLIRRGIVKSFSGDGVAVIARCGDHENRFVFGMGQPSSDFLSDGCHLLAIEAYIGDLRAVPD